MAKKQTKHKKPDPLVCLDSAYSMEFKFSRRFQKDPETLRRLAHRVVDLLADAGHYDWLADSVAGDLVCLADDFVIKNVTDLIREARAPGKAVTRG
ncbi:MAG: hypothetical protein IIC01_11830 [Planctomycetes bacterium]|nr:hypothetical protein [Planctomycetota bacterium]